MSDNPDPRVFFAAERTLLAWLRTALAIVGLGFVVARFGLFLRALGHTTHEGHLGAATVGVTLVVLGGMTLAGATWQHATFCRTLGPSERPVGYHMSFAVWVSSAVTLATAALAVLLVWT